MREASLAPYGRGPADAGQISRRLTTMPSAHETKIATQAPAHLEPGEEVVASIVAQPRGATTAKMSGLAPSMIGDRQTAKQRGAAERAGLQLVSPMALVLTDRRLIVFAVSSPLPMGKGADIERLVSAVALEVVESISVKRLLIGKTITILAGGETFKLEAGAGADAKGLAEAFARRRQ